MRDYIHRKKAIAWFTVFRLWSESPRDEKKRSQQCEDKYCSCLQQLAIVSSSMEMRMPITPNIKSSLLGRYRKDRFIARMRINGALSSHQSGAFGMAPAIVQ